MREISVDKLTTVDAVRAIDLVFAAVGAELALSEAKVVRIPGFGIFRLKLRDTRQVRNPRTGETSTLAAHWVVTFKQARPGK